MIDLTKLTHIAFDADDTLWSHEDVFVDAKEQCLDLLRPYMQPDMDLTKELYRFERENLKIFGYGVKGFALSMIETAIQLSEGRISGQEIQRIISIAKEMLDHPIELLPHVREAVTSLRPHCKLLIITKGELFAQENKIARSGLADEFDIIEVISEKNPEDYRKLFARHNIDPATFLMIGNSLRSDILPVTELGGRAIHLPAKYTWHHEAVTCEIDTTGFWQPKNLAEATTALVQAFEANKKAH